MHSIGRFAPSPSGLLHFGSFVTALASYLQAKAKQGEWLVRIEDLDPPREVAGAAKHILTTLEKLGLHWDKEIVYQSARLDEYQHILDQLVQQKLAYYCDCSRQRIQHLPHHLYDNHCQNRHLKPSVDNSMAIRLKQNHPICHFIDNIRGRQNITQAVAREDFTIKRKDNLFAYNLAVVIDDHYQGVTEIVRGADLLPVTTKQISLYLLLGWQLPSYYHLPLVLDQNHNKLSKQNHAPPIKLDNIGQLMVDGLRFLGQPIPEDWQDATPQQLLMWAISHWNIDYVPKYDKMFNYE